MAVIKTAGIVIARCAVSLIVFCSVIILCQDLLIFPSLNPFISKKPVEQFMKEYAEYGLEVSFITTSDGEQLEAWYLPPRGPRQQNNVAILFHGSGGTLPVGFGRQVWFQAQGIPSYAVHPRGIGHSSGWPSEQGIQLDTEAIWDYALSREKLEATQVIVVGESLGTGPATYLAHRRSAGTLLLFGPYTDLKTAARHRKLFRPLLRFLRYDFPNISYISSLKNTCVISVHGKKDTLIPYTATLALEQAYGGSRGFHTILEANAGHEDLFPWKENEIVEKLETCIGSSIHHVRQYK